MTEVQATGSTEPKTTVDPAVVQDARYTVASDLAALREIYGEPGLRELDKVSPLLIPLMIEFLNASSMYFLATADAQGRCDVSPRGDPAGSVLVTDPTTLILPDRRGNKRIDSISNILENARVGLLFLVPGSEDTLRINGRASISLHQPLLDAMPQRGITPNSALIVDIDEAYMHCPRAFKRSGFWNSGSWPAKDSFPSMSAIMHQQLNLPGTVEELTQEREGRAIKTLY